LSIVDKEVIMEEEVGNLEAVKERTHRFFRKLCAKKLKRLREFKQVREGRLDPDN